MDPYDALVDLSACVVTTFEERERPPACFNGVIPGDGVTSAWGVDCDNGLCGMTWVRLITAYPSETIGAQSQTTGNCNHGLGLDIEVGVLRCTPVDLPDDADEEEADALQSTSDILADMMALRAAIYCCSSFPSKDIILGNWTPMGPLGGLVGGVWTLYAGLV